MLARSVYYGIRGERRRRKKEVRFDVVSPGTEPGLGRFLQEMTHHVIPTVSPMVSVD